MIQFEFIENTFIKKNTSIYELSILLGMDSFVYMVTDSQQKIQTLAQYPYDGSQPYDPAHPSVKKLEQQIKNNPILNGRFRNIRLGVHSPVFTLIPNRLYAEKDKRSILKHLSPQLQNLEIRADNVNLLNSKIIYGLMPVAAEMIKRHFSAARIFNLNTTMLLATSRLAQNKKEGHQLFFHVDSRYLRIFLFEGKNLLAATHHRYQTPKDFIYYALLTFEQFKLSPLTQEVYLCGNIETDSEHYQLLYRYVRDIHFMDAPGFIQKGAKTKALQDHRFFDLYSSLLLN